MNISDKILIVLVLATVLIIGLAEFHFALRKRSRPGCIITVVSKDSILSATKVKIPCSKVNKDSLFNNNKAVYLRELE